MLFFTIFVLSIDCPHNMHKRLLQFILLVFFTLIGHSHAQNVSLSHTLGRTRVSLDLDRLYNYNNYERHRWGAGVDWIIPLKYDERYGTLFQNYFITNSYIGYGTGDHGWKYGITAGFVFPRATVSSVSLSYFHDLLRVGDHSLDGYNLLNTVNNSSYFSSRYSEADKITAIAQIELPGPAKLRLGYSYLRERLLFNATNLLFPHIYDDDVLPYQPYNTIGIDLLWGDHIRLGFLTNVGKPDEGDILKNNIFSLTFIRLLAQYNNKITFKNDHGQMAMFAQGGYVTKRAPITQLFDLGGTGGGKYYFYNTFLTVRPNTFMSNTFAIASIRYTMGRGMWKTTLSEPHPFAQINAMWGMFAGNDKRTQTYAGLLLHAPVDGLIEPCLGIDGIVRWGLLDLGVAAAYQMTFKNSYYHIDNFYDKFAVMVIAKLVID